MMLGTLHMSTWRFRRPADHSSPQLDSSIILGITTHRYLTLPSTLGSLHTSTCQLQHSRDHSTMSTCQFNHLVYYHLPLPDSSTILGSSTHLYLTVSSPWGPISTCIWQVYHPGDHHPRLPDRSIILGITTHLYLTIPSPWGPLSTSTSQFHHPG